MNIIAEFGCNWRNSELAAFMMGYCKEMGINYIKFQLWLPGQVPPEVREMYIDKDLAEVLFKLGKQYGQKVFFTPFYAGAVHICEDLGVEFYKVRYGDSLNRRLYDVISATDKPVFVSCSSPIETIWSYYHNALFLYCVPEYPAHKESYTGVNKAWFDGISDHTSGLELLKECSSFDNLFWFEKHVCWNSTCFERKWSSTLEELKMVIK